MALSPFRRPDPQDLDIVNVLLLDDDDGILELLKHSLETRHFLVTAVRNGVEGLREIMAQDFDVIICDLMMPKMPGDMFHLAVQRTKPNLVDRFVFITGHGGNPKVAEFLSRVKAPVVMKPFTQSQVMKAIEQVLNAAAAKQK